MVEALSVGIVLAVALAVALLFRQGELSSANSTLKQQITTLERDNKKLQNQLGSKSSKYSKKAQEASRSEDKIKSHKQRADQLHQELQKSRGEVSRWNEKHNELKETARQLREQRERLRTQLTTAANRLKELGAHASQLETSRSEGSTEEAAPESGRRRGGLALTKLEKDLEFAHGKMDRMRTALSRLKRGVAEREAGLRIARRRNESNRRAYMITQLQLDLVQDELYVLKHGHAPEHPRSEKQKKRAALAPEQEQVVPDLEAGIIDLPDYEDEVEEMVEELMEAAEASEAEDASEDALDILDDTEAGDEDAVDALESDGPDESVSEEALSEEASSEDESEGDEVRGTVRLRKTARDASDTEVESAAGDSPTAPPRPGRS